MVKIINGHRYSTENSERLGSWDNGQGYSIQDFKYVSETLYRNPAGRYFLFIEGGAGTEYREAESYNSWVAGEKFVPMSEAEAKAWSEKRLNGQRYEKIWGPVED